MRWPAVACVILILGSMPTVLAVSPLVTDDADPVDRGHLELDGGWTDGRAASAELLTLKLNPVLGITQNAEVGFDFGYQWHRDHNSTQSGSTDSILETKYRFWQTTNERLKFGVRVDLKLPIAPDHDGLGTGKADTAVILLITQHYGKTWLDSNLGYNLIDLADRTAANDQLFFGQAIRQELSSTWWLIAEAYTNLPFTARERRSQLNFSAGAQYSPANNVTLSALISSAAGHHSPDLTSSLTFTVVF